MSEKTIVFELFQPFAQYRNPFTFYYAQTYPLPPKSTIIGMLQNACNDWYGNRYGMEKWWNLKVSVHGGFESVFWNYQSLIKGDVELKNDGKLWNQELPLYGKSIKSQRTPVYQQELFNGHLYIFIKGEDDLIEKIKESLEHSPKVLSLGRSEDVVFVKEIREIMPQKTIDVEGDIKLKYPTYILEENILKEKLPISKKKYPVYFIPLAVHFKGQGQYVKHKSEITKESERNVDFKRVFYTGYDYNLILQEGEKITCEFYELNGKKVIIIEGGWL